MNRSHRGVWRAFVALVLFAAIAQPAAAQANSSVEEVGVSAPAELATPIQVGIEVVGGEEVGVLDLPVVPRSSGRLFVAFTDLATRERVPVNRARPGKLVIDGQRGRQVKAGIVTVLHLVFTPVAKAKELEGVLSARVGKGAPLVRRVESAPADAKPNWKPTQETVEVTATRLLPFTDTPDVSRTIGVTAAEGKAGGAALGHSYATLDHYGNATVKVGAPEGEGPVKRAKVEVTDAGGVGSATAKVRLGEGEEAGEVGVSVKVGDSFLLPLVVVLIGVLIGKFGLASMELWRRGLLLRKDLSEARQRYEKAVGEATDGKLGLKGIEDVQQERTDLEKRLLAIGTSEGLESAAEEVKGVVAKIDGWIAIRKALIALQKAAATAKEASLEERGTPLAMPLADSHELLEREFKVDADIDRSGKLARTIQQQAVVLDIYASIAALAKDPAKERLESAQRRYKWSGPPLLRGKKNAEQLIEELRSILFAIKHEPKEDASPEVVRLETSSGLVAMASARQLLSPGTVITGAFNLIAPDEPPSPKRIMAEVRTGDWLVAIAAMLVSSLAYLLPLYVTGPFGTWQQYLGALVAGLGGQVLFSAALIPFMRSNKSSKPAAAPA